MEKECEECGKECMECGEQWVYCCYCCLQATTQELLVGIHVDNKYSDTINIKVCMKLCVECEKYRKECMECEWSFEDI